MRKSTVFLQKKINLNILLFLFIAIIFFSFSNEKKIPEFSRSRIINKIQIKFWEVDLRAVGVKLSGFSGYEPWGRWIDSKKAIIDFSSVMTGVVKFSMSFNCLGEDNTQGMKIYFGDHLEFFEISSCKRDTQTISKTFQTDNFSKIIIVPNYQIRLENDPRNLSIGILSLELSNDLR